MKTLSLCLLLLIGAVGGGVALHVDVLVFPSLEEDRLALHGIAYSLAVELVTTPLLMI